MPTQEHRERFNAGLTVAAFVFFGFPAAGFGAAMSGRPDLALTCFWISGIIGPICIAAFLWLYNKELRRIMLWAFIVGGSYCAFVVFVANACLKPIAQASPAKVDDAYRAIPSALVAEFRSVAGMQIAGQFIQGQAISKLLLEHEGNLLVANGSGMKMGQTPEESIRQIGDIAITNPSQSILLNVDFDLQILFYHSVNREHTLELPPGQHAFYKWAGKLHFSKLQIGDNHFYLMNSEPDAYARVVFEKVANKTESVDSPPKPLSIQFLGKQIASMHENEILLWPDQTRNKLAPKIDKKHSKLVQNGDSTS